MDINFEYYKIFYYVAKYCNFTKAARALGNSQPNVTRAMNNLEQQINSILFIRNNRGVQLTPEGERLNVYLAYLPVDRAHFSLQPAGHSRLLRCLHGYVGGRVDGPLRRQLSG